MSIAIIHRQYDEAKVSLILIEGRMTGTKADKVDSKLSCVLQSGLKTFRHDHPESGICAVLFRQSLPREWLQDTRVLDPFAHLGSLSRSKMVLKKIEADVPIPEVKVYNGLFHFNPSTTRGKWFFFAQVC